MTISTHTETVGTTTVKIVQYSIKRRSYIIRNNGSSTIFISGNTPVSSTQDFPIQQGGTFSAYAMWGDDVMHEVYAISTAAGQSVAVFENLEE